MQIDVQTNIMYSVYIYHTSRTCKRKCWKMPQICSKTVKITKFLPYIALNIGHGDLVSGMQLAVPNIMYIHHTSGTWKQKWLQEKGKPSKWVKITNVLANISCNIGHGDLVSGMQIDVPNIMHIHHTRKSFVTKCPNVPPKTSKRVKITQFFPISP